MEPHKPIILLIKKRFKSIILITVFLLSFFTYFVTNAAGTPSIISYQGRLADSNGDLLGGSGTSYYFKFSIWDSSTVGSGNRLWPTSAPQSSSQVVRNGVFNVNIGDTDAGFPDVLDYNFNNSKNVYLQIEVSSDNVTFQTLAPRQRIASTPFAQLSGAVSGSTTPSSFGTTTPINNSVVTIEATSTNTTALSIRSILNQIANIFSVQDSSGNNLVSINANGGIMASSTLTVGGATNLSSVTVSGLTTLGYASSTITSALDMFSVGRNATTTIRGESNATSTFAGGVYSNGLQVNGFSTTTSLRVSLGLFQDGLGDCSDEASNILYNSTTGKFSCGTDAGASGSGVSTIEENNSSVVTSALSIDFLGSDFIVTTDGSEGDIAIDYTNSGITRKSQNEIINGFWRFNNASTTAFSATGPAYFGSTATSSFSTTGALTLSGNLNGPLQANNGLVTATTSIGVVYG
ncbi:hypothetical protein EB001_17530, partial [bacterium]|nr:hypothetical protein [bacterium]